MKVKLRISLKAFLVLVFVCAAMCAWVGAMRYRSQVQRDAVQAILNMYKSKIDPEESYEDFDLRIAAQSAAVTYDSGDIGKREERGSWIPNWMLDIVGEECLHNATKLNLAFRTIGNDDLGHLKVLSDLESINLEATQITDRGLERLLHLDQLRHLCLGRTNITDDGLLKLQRLGGLEELELWHLQIGDNGIAHLNKMKQLKRLNLCFTNVTEEGVAHLEQSLPGCKIWWSRSQVFQLINKCPIALGWEKSEPNPTAIIQTVNFLHSLGKQKALSALREYTRIAPGEQNDRDNPYCQSKLSLLMPILFERISSKNPIADAPGSLEEQLRTRGVKTALNQRWPNFEISIEGDIPFHDVNFGGRSGPPFPSLRYLVDWAEDACRLRAKPLSPVNDPFQAALTFFRKA